MNKLSREDLWSLEEYAERRQEFRAQVIQIKRARRVALGAHASLAFENLQTMKYQIQEMLRTERIFEAAGINEELAAYNPLIPDGGNWKATFMIEYPDPEERRVALMRMAGIEHRVWARVGEGDQIFAIANEDMERSTDEKTAAVHFLRFELPRGAIDALKQGAELHFGLDHEALPYATTVDAPIRDSLIGDLD